MASISDQDRLESVYLTEKQNICPSYFLFQPCFSALKWVRGGSEGSKAIIGRKATPISGQSQLAISGQLTFNTTTSNAKKSRLLLVVLLLHPVERAILLILQKLG